MRDAIIVRGGWPGWTEHGSILVTDVAPASLAVTSPYVDGNPIEYVMSDRQSFQGRPIYCPNGWKVEEFVAYEDASSLLASSAGITHDRRGLSLTDASIHAAQVRLRQRVEVHAKDVNRFGVTIDVVFGSRDTEPPPNRYVRILYAHDPVEHVRDRLRRSA